MVVVAVGADGEVDDPVPVKIAQSVHRDTEEIRARQGPGEEALGRADLLMPLDGSVRIQEEDPHRAPIGVAVVVEVGADGNVDDPVAVEVAERGDVVAKGVEVVEHTVEATRRVVDLAVILDAAVRIEKEQPDGATTDALIAVEEGADD